MAYKTEIVNPSKGKAAMAWGVGLIVVGLLGGSAHCFLFGIAVFAYGKLRHWWHNA